MNRAMIIGRLTRDPELRKTTGDVSVCNFTVAVDRRFRNASGETETDFIPVVVWRGQADNCYRYIRKGSQVAVAGSIQTRSYDANDGTKRYITEIVADEVEFLSRSNSDSASDGDYSQVRPENTSRRSHSDMEQVVDDELPF